ncbi:anillin, actin binding protein 2 isoform X4 [Anarrhichthys ocellatus]|uniref:anillin, actin binding protein 2 isoform X4 n=1 Tax=Anarrhichthys ocellatus TaxID=433405 RepID=UPI0012ED58EE|nr:anillin-like isoform X4 [Anarrhichthys ocellatus]
MEGGEENGANINLKRQREPLSDSEDNVFSPSEVDDGQKRRRLEAAGQENRSPKASSSGRLAELDTKPDTPMVPSVRSRVQQLTQRREGGAPLAQRCLSDPGADSPSVIFHEKSFREYLLGQGEFNQRMERFKVPVFQAGPTPTPSPASASPRTCSNFVSAIQQKLHGTPAPSSKQASRIRQEREEELSGLPFQPISENAWLKRSNSDPSLSQQGWTPSGPSSPSAWVPRSRGRVRWPPLKLWDHMDGDAEMIDGSFTEATTSCEEKQSSGGTGERAPSDSEAPVGLDSTNKEQLHMGWKEQNPHQGDEVHEEEGIEDKQQGTQQPQTVLKLSFSEDQSFSKAPFSENQNVSELPTVDEQSSLESAHAEESDKTETVDVSIVTEQGGSEVFSPEERDGSSYSEEGIEPSTDEELRLWRYPQDEEESIVAGEQEEYVCVKEEERELESSRVEKVKHGCVADHSEPSDIQEGECYLGDVSAEMGGSSEMQEDEKPRPELQRCLDESVKHPSSSSRDIETMESCGGLHEDTEDVDIFIIKPNQKDTGGCSQRDDVCQQSNEIQTVFIKGDNMDLESDRSGRDELTEASGLTETQTRYTELERNIKHIAKRQDESSATGGKDRAQSLTEFQVSDHLLETEQMEQDTVDGRQGVVETLCSKRVTFILEPELINDSTLSEANTSTESRTEPETDAELSSHDETNTAEIIDQMFEEVLEYAGRMEEGRGGDEDIEDHDSGIGVCPGDKDKIDTESEKEKSEEECDESKRLESNRDELTFPPSGILSPLSKSVEAVVTPLRLAASQESNPSSLLLTPEETTTPPAESPPLYSIDAYRTQRQSKLPTIQSVTPGAQRRAPEKFQPQPSVNTKEKITALSEEAGKLQTVINQTLQALSCCTDEEHGRGSLEEAEAEKLLLVSCEKRSALLAEVARVREERNSESGEDSEYVSQQACRGTVGITKIQLPLKVEFVCSSHKRTGRPSHYFFVLIRYGPCNIVATPLATAADAQNGDTISFPTSVTLKDIRSSFEIDVEVYSLSHTSGSNCSVDRTTTKSRVTPRKLLNTITRSSNSLTSAALPALNTRRSSNFFLVGSHKITLSSLGHSKFPLDKMKLEGKIRRLLGDEFQEKVPFLSPLEGNIYLQLDSESHSNVHHHGFLTMFELISGYGVWHRRYFVLVGCNMYYWNHPNDKETKVQTDMQTKSASHFSINSCFLFFMPQDAEGSISLSSSHSRCVRPVKRDSCARPFTFELVSNVPQQQDASAKCWFSADTKQERLDWMEKLNQALLDFNTWNQTSAAQTESQQSNPSSIGNLRESIL